MTTPETIVLSGALAQRGGRGGHAWVFLQYLLGLRRLGWDPVFVDWLTPDMCNRDGRVIDSANLAYLRLVMEGFGFEDSYALIDRTTGHSFGLERRDVIDRVRRAAALINVMGYLDDPELLAAAPLRVFLDIDPGFPQMWRALGLADPFEGHDRFVTIGENVGQPGCRVPTCGLDWITTTQPVVLDAWPPTEPSGVKLTSVATWRGPYAPVNYDGEVYGLRVHELRRFADLPRLTRAELELALDIESADVADRDRLVECGWRLVNPLEVASDPWAYRDYVQASAGEFMIAKGMYVQARCGWLSDRSLCYLASGRPVVAQDTGLRARRGRDQGLLLFETLDEARVAADEVTSDGARQGRAAREIAEEWFDSDVVLGALLSEMGVS